jgi:pyruvate,water dikinase
VAESGLKRGKKEVEISARAEAPLNVLMAEQLARCFDSFSIGSKYLTQLVPGVERYSSELAYLFVEQHLAMKAEIERPIASARRKQREVGLCGQGPSDHSKLAAFLMSTRFQ